MWPPKRQASCNPKTFAMKVLGLVVSGNQPTNEGTHSRPTGTNVAIVVSNLMEEKTQLRRERKLAKLGM